MQVYKCDRCGHIMEEIEAVIDLYLDHHKTHDSLQLCEQCYTTIKEVLEDGEIS